MACSQGRSNNEITQSHVIELFYYDFIVYILDIWTLLRVNF